MGRLAQPRRHPFALVQPAKKDPVSQSAKGNMQSMIVQHEKSQGILKQEHLMLGLHLTPAACPHRSTACTAALGNIPWEDKPTCFACMPAPTKGQGRFVYCERDEGPLLCDQDSW